MIGLHTIIWWMSKGNDGFIIKNWDKYEFILTPYVLFFGWLSLSFAFTSGFSFHLWIFNKSNFPNLFSIIKRVLFLFIVGWFLNPKSWYIFQFLSVSMALSYLLIKYFCIEFIWIFTFLSPFGANILRYFHLPWEGSYLEAILIGDKNGLYFWPFFPWYFLFGCGILFRDIKLKVSKKSRNLMIKIFLILSLSFLNIGEFFKIIMPTIDLTHFWGTGIFQPNLFQFFSWSALIINSFIAVEFVSKFNFKKIFYAFKKIGEYSLIIYIIHYKFFVSYVFLYKNDDFSRLFILILLQILFSIFIGVILDFFIKKVYMEKQIEKKKNAWQTSNI